MCQKCGALRIDDQIGLESTPDEYVAKLVSVFREVKRVLKDDGTCWINLGDSFSVGSNFLDCFNRLMKSQPLIFGNAATIGITPQGGNVPLNDNGFPYRVFLNLLGIERVIIKQRDNNFCQVLHTPTNPCYCWISFPVCFMSRNVTDLEIVLDAGDNVNIIISNHDPNGKPVLGVSGVTSTPSSKGGNGSFAIKETGKPITEIILDGQTIGHPVTLDPVLERLPDIYFIDKPVAFGDGFNPTPCNVSDLRVTKSTQEQLSFSAFSGRINITAIDVTHLYALNSYGSLVRYVELYDKAIRLSNATQAKQELGIPEMVKRALMEDGWICRSTIIWHKPNPMPESVKDRPTKAHEYVFLLSKSQRYYYDAESVQEESNGQSGWSRERKLGKNTWEYNMTEERIKVTGQDTLGVPTENGFRNKRDVWTINTQPTSCAHFATYPEKLVEPCVLAGTSAKGQCPKCGANWVRNLIVIDCPDRTVRDVGENRIGVIPGRDKASRQNSKDMTSIKYSEVGWRPTCGCGLEPVPNIVFDPFAGSGTTGRVAHQHGREFIGCELNYEYIDDISRRRLTVDVMLPGILSNTESEL